MGPQSAFVIGIRKGLATRCVEMKTLAFFLYITFFSVWFAVAAAAKIDLQQFHFEKEVNELVSDAGTVCGMLV